MEVTKIVAVDVFSIIEDLKKDYDIKDINDINMLLNERYWIISLVYIYVVRQQKKLCLWNWPRNKHTIKLLV